jgi:hypothetical protein
VTKTANTWQVYRTRFLIQARQLTEPLVFVDSLGREHRGKKGDYLVESCDGARSIAPRKIFEDVYVALGGSRPAAAFKQSATKPGKTASVSPLPQFNGTGTNGAKLSGSRFNGSRFNGLDRKAPHSCGKSSSQPSTPAVNSLRYNM